MSVTWRAEGVSSRSDGAFIPPGAIMCWIDEVTGGEVFRDPWTEEVRPIEELPRRRKQLSKLAEAEAAERARAASAGPDPGVGGVAVVHGLYRELVRWAQLSETLAAAADHERGRPLLTGLARRCRDVIAVFDAAPELHAQLQNLKYARAMLRFEADVRRVYRQIADLLRFEALRYEDPNRPNAARWEEAETLAAELDACGVRLVEHAPDLRLDTVDGSHALARRLIDVDRLDKAAATIEAAIDKAGRLPHPGPVVDVLAGIAADLRERGAALRAETAESPDWWTIYFDQTDRAFHAAWQRKREELEPPARPGS